MKYVRWLDNNLEQLLVSIFTVVMMSVLALNVFLRFLWGHSITEAEELARYMFLYAVFGAASLAAQKDSHIRITAPTDAMPASVRKYFIWLSDAVWLCFNLFVTWSGIELVAGMSQFGYRSPALGWNMQFMYAVIPLSFGAMSLRIIQRYYRKIRYGWERREEDRDLAESFRD